MHGELGPLGLRGNRLIRAQNHARIEFTLYLDHDTQWQQHHHLLSMLEELPEATFCLFYDLVISVFTPGGGEGLLPRAWRRHFRFYLRHGRVPEEI